MPTLPTLPRDTAHFAAIRRRGQVYVDKTAYIQRILEEDTRYAFLARPRRFGKTLLLSTLKHLFERASDDLFRGLDIERSGFLARVPRMPTLQLDMSGTGSFDPEIDLHRSLRRVVGAALRPHGLPAPAPDALSWEALEDALWALQARDGGEGVAVLVDEYDAPLTDMWSDGPSPSNARQERLLDHLRIFYRVLKKMDAHLAFVFLTGIVQIPGAGLFSALNNLRNLSAEAAYSAMCGFTEAEIDRFLPRHVEQAARNYGCSPRAMRKTLQTYYDGYRFAWTREPVYNPISYLTALAQLSRRENAREIRATEFPRPWVDTGRPQFLFRLMQAKGLTLRDLDYGATDMRADFDLRQPALNALMYQTGFLTLKTAQGKPILDWPNLEVEASLQESLFFAYLGKPMGKESRERALMLSMAEALRQGDCGQAIANFDRILDRVPYALLQAESHFQLALHTVCSMIRSVLRVDSEVLTRRGRADTVVETRAAIYVFELKLDKSREEALRQLQRRGYRDKYAAEGKRVVGVGLNFIKHPNEDGQWTASPRNYEWALGEEKELPVRAREDGYARGLPGTAMPRDGSCRSD